MPVWDWGTMKEDDKMKDRKLWEKRLGSLKGYKKAVEEAEELGGKLPDARYTGKIEGAKLADSNAGNPQIVVNGKIVGDEEFEGESFTAFMGLGEQGLRYTLATLKRLGFEIEGDDPKEILDVVESLDSSNMSVVIKVKDGYANISGPAEDVSESKDDNEDTEEDEEEDDEETKEDDSEEEEEEETEDSEEEEEEKEESKELAEGSKVTWEKDGKKRTGTIVEILEDNNMARIEKEDGGITRVAMDLLTIVTDDSEEEEQEEIEEEEEEVEEEKVAKPKKAKPAVKKAKKKSRR